MDTPTADSSTQPVVCEWNPEFLKERQFNRKSENVKFIQALLRGFENGESEVNEDDDVIYPFLLNAHDVQMERIEDFCADVRTTGSFKSLSLSSSQTSYVGTAAVCLSPIAFIMDHDRRGEERQAIDELTVVDLYDALSQPRFSDNSSESEVPAEQRHIYIRDLSAHAICALVATAPESQIEVLQRLIHDHLAFDPYIGVTLPDKGFAYYSMEFHTPYYALVTSPTYPSDYRSLREVEDISFLSTLGVCTSGQQPKDYLCQAQISCSLSGYDESVWTVHFFADSYHEMPQSKGILEDSQADPVSDPFTWNRRPIPSRSFKPRERFLEMLRHSIRIQRQEWARVIHRVSGLVEDYIDSTEKGNPTMNAHGIDITAKVSAANDVRALLDHERQQRKERSRIRGQTTALLRKLMQSLESIIDAYEGFLSQEYEYFYPRNISRQSDRYRKLTFGIITKETAELRRLVEQLESQLRPLQLQDKQYDSITQDFQLDLAIKEDERKSLQQIAADETKNLTLASFYLLPFQIANAILSSGSLLHYVLLTIVVTAITQVLIMSLGGWNKYELVFERWKARMVAWWNLLKGSQSVLSSARNGLP
ncbi:hypothetical protein F5Y16DRAFT_303733 [Xylariaceae sp. FL0255]|nr:hypothetical protein F5Y16DRAFT_303733 [Xylariaceae sp. FL0255]